ncbi:MAG: UDP-N-acetylmuramate--L-alanine ligase [Nocardioidaceae bacterium]
MRIDVPAEIETADRLGRVHFVGIGGAGLSAIARIMVQLGIEVSGSDAHDSATLQSLRAAGARCSLGHDAANVRDADTVVASTAVRADNPEVVEAVRLGLRLYPRSAGLQSVMLGHRVVAVAGTHGKTTTTSMLAEALVVAGADPSYAIGADVASLGSNARHGGGELFVAEADESDGAFLVYTPWGAVVTNVDADHLDNYGSLEAYRAAFDAFLERIDPGGFLVVCVDDPGAARLGDVAAGRGLRTLRVGTADDADLRAVDLVTDGGGTSFDVVDGRRMLGRVALQVPGRHYAVDALAALAAGLECGQSFGELARGLGSYRGARRRMEPIGEAGGVRVYDSYAHHPVEIAGDLQAARSLAGSGRLVVCFQPHLVSRTRIFGAQMGEALGAADVVVVADIYVAREDPDPGVTSALVRDHVPLPEDRVHAGWPVAELPEQLAALVRPGDLVLTLGAGDVTLVAPAVLEHLGGES